MGSRVVTFGWSGAWARLRAVDTENLAVVPESVDLGAASALPVAGVSALQAVRRLGSVLGRRALVTGASAGESPRSGVFSCRETPTALSFSGTL
ncbi:hypothetical protein ACQPYK_29760 [Streptosporangium sp. CA-135522]|uniref:hypothetical protein n=1 Tax=Streptosporangium sp. CA-135522 TaxID=3240072 RepID=UPI003D8CFCB6